MTIKELKQNAPKSKAFREVLSAIKHKPYVCEEALISEEAEKLFKHYKYIYSKLHTQEYAQNCYFIQQCILPKYKTFDEAVDIIRRLSRNQVISDEDLAGYYTLSKMGVGTKYSTFKEALAFLKLSNK